MYERRDWERRCLDDIKERFGVTLGESDSSEKTRSAGGKPRFAYKSTITDHSNPLRRGLGAKAVEE
jgi:hypothetical protein